MGVIWGEAERAFHGGVPPIYFSAAAFERAPTTFHRVVVDGDSPLNLLARPAARVGFGRSRKMIYTARSARY